MIATALKMGQRVRVWPRPGARVPEHPSLPGRFLPSGGADVEWSTWWARRLADGSVLLIDPRAAPVPRAAVAPPAPPAPTPARAPAALAAAPSTPASQAPAPPAPPIAPPQPPKTPTKAGE